MRPATLRLIGIAWSTAGAIGCGLAATVAEVSPGEAMALAVIAAAYVGYAARFYLAD